MPRSSDLRERFRRWRLLRRIRGDYIIFDGTPREKWGDSWYYFPLDGWWQEAQRTLRVRVLAFHPVRDPRPGDLVEMKMDSGRLLMWLVTESQRQYDPPDQFEAKGILLGYADEVALPRSEWQRA